MAGLIYVAGIGPGSPDWIAPGVLQALEDADVILGYHTYLEQIRGIAPHLPRETSGMRREVQRARRAVALALDGKKVAVVSGGDPGIYGMAGLIFELLAEEDPADSPPVEVLPGISALNAAAALLGAPLMNDFAAISLSDHLTPVDVILRRVSLAAQAGFVLCLYNPRSRSRTGPFERVCQTLREHCAPQTPVGVVRAAFRPGQRVECVALEDLDGSNVGMDAILIVGNASTRLLNGKMVTSRGYQQKYALREAS